MRTVKPETIKQYEKKINTIHKKIYNEDMKNLNFLNDTPLIIDFIYDEYGDVKTSSLNFFIAIVSILSRNNFKKEIIDEYRKHMLKLLNKKKQEEGDNILTEKEEKNYIEWYDVFNKISPTSIIDNALYILITRLPPRRNLDYQHLRITFKNYDTIEDIKKLSKSYNYYIPKKNMIVYNRYKTDSYYGSVIIELNKKDIDDIYYNTVKKTLKDLIKNINYEEGAYIFGTLKSNFKEPLRHFTVKKIFTFRNKSASINLLRHAYISHYLNKKRTSNQMKNVSFLMSHSIYQQSRYRKLKF